MGWRRAANNSLLFAFSPDEESSQKFIPFVGVSVVVAMLSQASWDMFSSVNLNLPGVEQKPLVALRQMISNLVVGCSCLIFKQTSKTLQQTTGCILLLRQECDVSLET